MHMYATIYVLVPTVFSYDKTGKFPTFDLENEGQGHI